MKFGNIKLEINDIEHGKKLYKVSWKEDEGVLTKDFAQVEMAVEKHIKGIWGKLKWRRWKHNEIS